MFERSLSEMSTLPELAFLNKTIYVRQDPDCQGECQLRMPIMYVKYRNVWLDTHLLMPVYQR